MVCKALLASATLTYNLLASGLVSFDDVLYGLAYRFSLPLPRPFLLISMLLHRWYSEYGHSVENLIYDYRKTMGLFFERDFSIKSHGVCQRFIRTCHKFNVSASRFLKEYSHPIHDSSRCAVLLKGCSRDRPRIAVCNMNAVLPDEYMPLIPALILPPLAVN